MEWMKGRDPANKVNQDYDAAAEIAWKDRRNTLLGAEAGSKPVRGFEKYFGTAGDTHVDHPVTGRLQRRAVAAVNRYWGIYGVYRENFFQGDNDRLARNPIFAICEKGFMDYLGIVEWEVIDHEENQVDSATEFLKNPNPQDTFPTLLKTAGRDIIRYDAGVWVKTLSMPDSAGKQYLLELKAYSGPEFWIEIDRDWSGLMVEHGLSYQGPYSHGYVKRYWQHAQAGVFIPFDPSEVVYLMCYPRADTCYGTDFMADLKWYLEYLIDSTKAAGMTFANGIMPGLKYKHPQYSSVTQLIEANKELEAANLGPENFNGVVNLIGEEDIEPLTPTLVDMQWLEGQEWVAKIVWAMFGFSASEFTGDDSNRATAYVARNITKSRMLSPILRKFEEMINHNILPDLPDYKPGWKFRFKDIVDLDDELKEAQIDQARAQIVTTYMQLGVPLEAAMRIAEVEESKIDMAVRSMEEVAAQEPGWDQGMEGGGGPMGPPGPDGGINTNPQGGQALSPEEASQFYANGSEDMGPQLYRREDYQGSATSQDHEGSDEDFGKIQKAEDPDAERSKPYTQEEVQKVLKKYSRREAGHGIETEIDDERELEVIISQTKFALISAGPNSDEHDLDDSFFRERHNKLRDELKRRGYVFTQVLGMYEGYEDSFLVMTHDADRAEMIELGGMMNQNQVIYVDHGQNEMITTRGDRKGAAVAGQGFSWVEPEAEDFYTSVFLDGRNASVNFALKFDDTEYDEDVERPKEDHPPREVDPVVFDKLTNDLYEDGKTRVDQAYEKIKPTVKKYRGEFAGLEYRLKTSESIRKGFDKEHKRRPWLSEEELATHIDDVVRYTAVLTPERYHQDMNSILKEFGQKGIEVLPAKNFWRSGQGCYRGVNVKLKIDGKSAEIQFHTPESYEIKQKKTHHLYKIVNDPESTKDQIRSAAEQIRAIYKSCRYPPKMETWHYSK